MHRVISCQENSCSTLQEVRLPLASNRLGIRTRVTAAQMIRVKEMMSPSCIFAATSDKARTEKPEAMAMALVIIGGPVLEKACAML